MSIEHDQIMACFLHHFITFFFLKVRSWSVRTGPENFCGPVRLLGPLVDYQSGNGTVVCHCDWY